MWIDFDQDSVFSDEELVFSGNTTASLSGSFDVPSAALEGLTRMRVAMRYGSAPSPCGSFTYGEVEDYSVTITGEWDPIPPVVEYCSSYGTSTNYEWIESIKAGSFSWISGNSHGYADHTGGASVDLRIGWPVTLVLEPGFGYGSYTEHWRVWVEREPGWSIRDGRIALQRQFVLDDYDADRRPLDGRRRHDADESLYEVR